MNNLIICKSVQEDNTNDVLAYIFNLADFHKVKLSDTFYSNGFSLEGNTKVLAHTYFNNSDTVSIRLANKNYLDEMDDYCFIEIEGSQAEKILKEYEEKTQTGTQFCDVIYESENYKFVEQHAENRFRCEAAVYLKDPSKS